MAITLDAEELELSDDAQRIIATLVNGLGGDLYLRIDEVKGWGARLRASVDEDTGLLRLQVNPKD